MTRPVTATATAVAVAALLLPGAGCAVLDRPPPPAITIGADLNLSGTGSALDTAFHNALRLRLEQLNHQQPTGGRRLALRVSDNRGDPAVAAGNLAELAGDPAVAAIVTGGCGECTATAGEEWRVPTISLAATAPVAGPAAQHRYAFRLGPNAGDNADRLSQELAGTGAGTVGLVSVDDPYGREGERGLSDAAERDGIAVVTRQRVGPGGQGVPAAARAVALWRPDPAAFPAELPAVEAGPDAVVVWAYPAAAAEVAAGLRQAGYTGALFLDAVAADELFLAEPALAGARLVFTGTPVMDQQLATSPAAAARKTWVRAYLARYGTYHVHASWAADAVNVIADAVRRAGDSAGDNAGAGAGAGGGSALPDREAIRDKIETARMDGLTGLIRFTAEQHSGLHPSSLQLLTAGDRWR